MKLGKIKSYLDALLPQVEGSLHNSNCSVLPRHVNGVKVTKKVTQSSKSLDGPGRLSETCEWHTCNLKSAAILEMLAELQGPSNFW